MSEAQMHSFARNSKQSLVEHLEAITQGYGNRTPVLTLIKMVDSPAKARMVFETLQSENFLDPESKRDERNGYAWELTLHAVESWVLLAMATEPEPGRSPGTEEGIDARAEHLRLCALRGSFHNWLSDAEKTAEGLDEGDQELQSALDALNAYGKERLVGPWTDLLDPEALDAVTAALKARITAIKSGSGEAVEDQATLSA